MIKSFLYNRYDIWGHSQNLNDRTGIKGSIWRHGRGWLRLTPFKTSLNIEWSFFRKTNNFGLTIRLNDRGETQVMFYVGLPYLLALYFTIENDRFLGKFLPGKWVNSSLREGEKFWMPIDRRIGIKYHHGSFWFSLWENPMEWNGSDPRWWQFSINVPDLIFGKSKFSETELESGRATLYFREDGYDVDYKKTVRTWKRPRWFAKSRVGYEFEMDNNPIPIPGKGENSWDIGDDAIYSAGVPATSLAEALGKLTQSVLRDRIKYGNGTEWIPDEKTNQKTTQGTKT